VVAIATGTATKIETTLQIAIETTRQMPPHVQQASIFLLTKMAEPSARETSDLVRKFCAQSIGGLAVG